MGERGGAVRVWAWECPTCLEHFKVRAEAVACCNILRDVVSKQEATQKRKRSASRRAFQAAPSPRVTIRRSSYFPSYSTRRVTDTYAEAKVKCPRCRTYGGYTIRIRVKVTHSVRRAEAIKRARNLCKARLARHIYALGCS